jgi:hypothetical protein
MAVSASGSPLDFNSVNQAVKIHYKALRVADMVYRNNPFLGVIPKYTKFGGLSLPIPVRYHDPQRRSSDFVTGQGNASTSELAQFSLTRVSDYSFAYIDGQTVQATRGDNNAFLQYLTMEIDGALNSLTRSLAVSMYGDGSGKIGTASTVVAGTAANPGATPPVLATPDIITLANSEEVTNFEVGMSIVAAASTAGAPGTAMVITTVDRDAGTIGVAQGTASGKIVATNVIFQEGDYMAASNRKKVTGLDGWLPAAAPAANSSFFGVDRSVDSTRLGGVRFDGSSMPVEEALIEAASKVARDGGRPDTAFCDFKTYASLEKSLGARVRYTTLNAPDVQIGFNGISIVGPSGEIKIAPDLNCNPDAIYLLQMDTWSLNSLGAAPQFLDLDDNKILRDSGADAYECRLGYYAQMGCSAPGYNARIALA